MSKDPAFLFYSKDFYEGTRTMLPEERACYIDLLIYQHQNDIIPLDLRRVLLYCNGISEATLKTTLEAKFKQVENGWINDKLKTISLERLEYAKKQSVNGTVGQFWKKSKAILDDSDYISLRNSLKSKTVLEVYELTKNLVCAKDSLKALLKHLAIENANEDVIEIKDDNEFDYKSELLKLVSNKVLVNDFVNHRISKNASLGKTAFDSLVEECGKRKFSIEEALKISLDKNWVGFKLEWVDNINKAKSNGTGSNTTTKFVNHRGK